MSAIVYYNEDEVLVTDTEHKEEMLKQYFFPDSGRNVEDYNVKELCQDNLDMCAIEITNSVNVW